MTYKFPQFSVEIIDPTISVINVLDNLPSKSCSAEISLTTESTNFGVTLSGFVYTEDWNDADVATWVAEELKQYEV